MKRRSWYFFVVLLIMHLHSCRSKEIADPMFVVLNAEKTGLDFTNKLTPTGQFNMFHYMYFYNGAGLGAADFNKDGLTDLFFSSNQGSNKLYLNRGEMKFDDVSEQARIPKDTGWSTGVSIVDINNDGLPDIYVCRVGNYEGLKSRNQFLICQGLDKNGVPFFKDEAATYGLDFSGFSTQALFLDYDLDGDLDMFLLNHSVHQNGSFTERKNFIGTYSPLSGDRIYRNNTVSMSEQKHIAFTDVTRQTGINSSAISYGLGIAASDINLDGYPDLYAGNDFHENDYLYINQHNGTYKEELTQRIMHTSQFSMGVDIADVDNNGYPEIISMDMLPSDPYILKRSLGEDEFNIFNLKVSYGYSHQYSRNNLQLNRNNGMFSEVGLYSGIYATDWSWAALWMDFDNDGWKDLFVSNGIPKRLNDMDYINYVSNEEVQEKIRTKTLADKDMTLIEKFPQIKLPNKFYRNNGELVFTDMAGSIEGDKPTYSNGSVYADLDNDGDLDVAVNNIDDAAVIYKNTANDKNDKLWLKLRLEGAAANISAVGAKVIVYANNGLRIYEKFPVRGFQSSMDIPVHVGLDKTKVDSILLVWPDNTYQGVQWEGKSVELKATYKSGLPHFNYSVLTSRSTNNTKPATDITRATGLDYVHHENAFNEFDREPLIPHMVSREGPALAVGDVNNDGLQDVFLGSSKTFKSAVFVQTANGGFTKVAQPALEADSMYEYTDACWADVNNDTYADLIAASGGNEYYGEEGQRTPVVYLNDGEGKLSKLNDAFQNVYLNGSCVALIDFNGDGYTDLFAGGRNVPWSYGEIPRSYLLQNDGTGHFKDVTTVWCKDLATPGLVTDAAWHDMDKDGDPDLILSLEWGGICAFLNNKRSFSKKVLTDKSGWWNFVLPLDVDGDGDTDLVAGNLGLNSRLKASEKEPVKMYYYDFDDNGKKDQVLTYYLNGREIPFASKDELQRQMPFLKKKFLYAGDFAKATLPEVFSQDKLSRSQILSATYFSNAILINDGHLNFSVQAMPWQAQLTSFRDALVMDANGDNMPDILLGGNFYGNNPQVGRYDADFGTLLVNHGRGKFTCSGLNGLTVKGEIRKIKNISIANKQACILAKNDDSARIISFRERKKPR